MKNVLIVFFLLMFSTAFTQVKKAEGQAEKTSNGVPKKAKKAAYNQYRIITLEKASSPPNPRKWARETPKMTPGDAS